MINSEEAFLVNIKELTAIFHLLKEKDYTRVYGVDISPSQIKLAKQHTSNVGLRDAIEFLQTTPKQFDLILVFDVIEHLNKNEVLEFIAQCYSKLNKGGRIVIQTPNASSPFFGGIRYGDFTHELGFTPKCSISTSKADWIHIC